MLDFVEVCEQRDNRKRESKPIIYPEFVVGRQNDLMVRGKSFYAIWDEEAGFWSTQEADAARLIDKMILEYKRKHELTDSKVLLLRNFSSNMWTAWQKYYKSLPDRYHELDSKIVFKNDKIEKEDYVTKTLPYCLEDSEISSYEKLVNTLYQPDERRKLEWAIGAIIKGDSKTIQKFIVLYGGPGTGKSTILNIIEDLFEGYCVTFNAKALASASDAFSLEAFRDNPLVAIQHDGDLSRIEDNTKINSIVSHEKLRVNEKFKATYAQRFHTFLFMGTNKPVKITDAKSGLIRRLIDVHPSGNIIPKSEYDQLMRNIRFELGGIAYHCLQVYDEMGPDYYNGYIPNLMLCSTNDFYNFIEDNFDLFEKEDPLVLKTAWMRYREYCEDARVQYPYSMRNFRSELRNYYTDFKERYDGQRSVYFGFLKEKFQYESPEDEERVDDVPSTSQSWLKFHDTKRSDFDDIFKDCPAQYAVGDGKPGILWDEVTTTLSDIDATKLHYVRVPKNLVVIDFDIKNEKGEKDLEANLKEASKWPATYAELSKSQAGIHLHYYYTGDPEELKRVYGPGVEIKVFNGKSSLRRMLTKCTVYAIATISSGLPIKEVKNRVIAEETIKSEKSLRKLIERNLRKEIHPGTKPSIDFIYKILNDAYEQGLHYDVTDMRNDIQSFALRSTHQADYCLRMVGKMKFRSEEPSENIETRGEEIPIVFFDVEVFPNLFVICAKRLGPGNAMIKMINPTPEDVRSLTEFRLVGFNNRRYDNHILYARMMGYSEEELYRLSQRIIMDKNRDAFFREAYNLSYTDIYDYMSAANKMSLKKWEIKLGIHHQELDLPWNKPVPEEMWQKVADYCCNDVIATEAVWDATQADFLARSILAEWAEMTVNDTTNSLTTRIIVGKDPHPQEQYIYTDLSTIFKGYEYNPYGIDPSRYLEGAKIVRGKSWYRGEDPGEGGYVYAEPGIYYNVALLDIASMHPHSAIALKIFGEYYTKRFEDIVEGRVAIKHKDVELVKSFLPERLWHYLDDPKKFKALANAIKTAINSVYGLTSASFDNKLKDPRNVDNIVAKYGALFMIDLKHEVQDRGYTVVHIKTDSIKIANADPEIIQFVMDYGKKYGYTFEHEDTYSKICLVNDAVYIAKYKTPHIDEETGKEIKWTATGTQFQVPYVFKTLFSHEKINFRDLCETKSVESALYLDMNEQLDPEGLNFVGEEFHNRKFVGRVGSFCPVKPGHGGGILLRQDKDDPEKFVAANNTKVQGSKCEVYRWLEEETVKQMGDESIIDMRYWDYMVDEAVEAISKYGDFERFVADDDFMYIPDGLPDEVPFEQFPMNQPVAA